MDVPDRRRNGGECDIIRSGYYETTASTIGRDYDSDADDAGLCQRHTEYHCPCAAECRSTHQHHDDACVLADRAANRRGGAEGEQACRVWLLERISRELSSEFGNGFGEPHLRNCRLFYKAYPTEAEIRYTLCIKLSWSHHRLIMRVPEPKARQYYLKEAESQEWSVRELQREIRTFAYERVVANQIEPDGAMDGERHELTPENLLKDPCVAEFLNLRERIQFFNSLILQSPNPPRRPRICGKRRH